MSRVSLALTLLVALTGPAFAEEKPIKEGPESFGYASFKDGKVRIKCTQMQFVDEARKIKQGDKEVLVTVIRPRWVIASFDHDAKKVKLYDEKGKEVPAKDVPKTLEKEQRVVLTSSAKLDPFFAEFIKPGTYILVVENE